MKQEERNKFDGSWFFYLKGILADARRRFEIDFKNSDDTKRKLRVMMDTIHSQESHDNQRALIGAFRDFESVPGIAEEICQMVRRLSAINETRASKCGHAAEGAPNAQAAAGAFSA